MLTLGMRSHRENLKATIAPKNGNVSVYNIKEIIGVDSTLCTDWHQPYGGMPEHRYRTVCCCANQYMDNVTRSNRIRSVWVLLKWEFQRTYRSFDRKYPQRYTDKFVIWPNSGNFKIQKLDHIDALLEMCWEGELTYA